VAGPVALAGIGWGLNVLGYPAPSFGLAKFCFIASAVILIGATIISAVQLNTPVLIQAAMAACTFAAGIALLVAGLLWIAWRQSEQSARAEGPRPTPQGDNKKSTAEALPLSLPAAAAPMTATHAPSTVATAVGRIDAAAPASGPGSRSTPLTDPSILIRTFSSRTDAEAAPFAARKIGWWLQIEGAAVNVTPEDHNVTAYVVFNKPYMYILSLQFSDPAQKGMVMALRQNEKIRAIGRIAEFDRMNIRLEECELLSP